MPSLKSRYRAATLVLIGFVCLLSAGCAADRVRQQAASERKVQRTQQLLIAAGDADSLAAAVMLSFGPKADPAQRLTLISRAVEAAPDRPELLWLNIRLCADVEGCNPEPLEGQLQKLDPGNGAAWAYSIGRAEKRKDPVALRQGMAALAMSTRFDIYWNTTIARVTNAILKTHTMDLPTALIATIGMSAALSLPPYLTIANACKGESLKDPDTVSTCRQVATVMRHGDTYMTEMIGLAIATRAWPKGSAEYLDAVNAQRVGHYRMDTDAKISVARFSFSRFAAKRLQLMTDNHSEQEVNLAEIARARLSPDPPADWTGR